MADETELRTELVRLRTEMIALLAINQTLRMSRDHSELYRVVAAQVMNVVPCDSLFIAAYLPETDSLRYVYSVDEGIIDDEITERPLDEAPLSAKIVRSSAITRIDDLDDDPRRKQGGFLAFGNVQKRSRSWLGVPMLSGETVQGVLSVQSYEPGVFTNAHADILLLLASQVSVALENARLVEQFRRTIAELSTPLMPVAEGVLVLPLIGTLDAERADRLVEQVLDGVVQQQADWLLIDVTGLATVDEFAIGQIVKVVRAAALLGARSAIAGMSAAMATGVVALGLDLGQLEIYRDLRGALAALMPSATA